jgi:hypothetical protein
MDDPVVAADGHTYNRVDIENWLKQHNTSPHTNEELDHKMLTPNIAIRRQINAWREEHGLPALTFAKPAKAQTQNAGGGGAAADGAQLVKPSAATFILRPNLFIFLQAAAAARIAGKPDILAAAQNGDFALVRDHLTADASCVGRRDQL